MFNYINLVLILLSCASHLTSLRNDSGDQRMNTILLECFEAYDYDLCKFNHPIRMILPRGTTHIYNSKSLQNLHCKFEISNSRHSVSFQESC